MRDGGGGGGVSETATTNGAIIVIFIAPRRTFVFRDAASHRIASHRRAKRERARDGVQCKLQSLSLSLSLSHVTLQLQSEDEKCIKSFRTIRTGWTARREGGREEAQAEAEQRRQCSR